MSLGGEPCELASRLDQQWDAARQLASVLQSSVAGFLAAAAQPPSLNDLRHKPSARAPSNDPGDTNCSGDVASSGINGRVVVDDTRLQEAAQARTRGIRSLADVIRQQSIVLSDVTFHLCNFLEASCSLSPEELVLSANESPLLRPLEESSNLPPGKASVCPLPSGACTDEAAWEAANGVDDYASVTIAGSEGGGWSEDLREGECSERDADAEAAASEQAEGEEYGDRGGALAAWGGKGPRNRRARRRFYAEERDELRKALLEHLTLLRLEEQLGEAGERAEWGEQGEWGEGETGGVGCQDGAWETSGSGGYEEESGGDEEVLMAQARAAAEAARAAARARHGGEGEEEGAERGSGQGDEEGKERESRPPTLQQGSPRGGGGRGGLGGRERQGWRREEGMANEGIRPAVSAAAAVADVALMVERELWREMGEEQVIPRGASSPPLTQAQPVSLGVAWQQPWWLAAAAPSAAGPIAAAWRASAGPAMERTQGLAHGAAEAGRRVEGRTGGGFAEFSRRSDVGFAAFATSRLAGDERADEQPSGAGEAHMPGGLDAGSAEQQPGKGSRIGGNQERQGVRNDGRPLSPLFTLMRR